ncbi:MAG: HEAT repeat domain-containing protein [Ardenticatenaceae bacterium]|nr:HEAT repeat domain-containing protein [Ardenticatenaceae bacterium]
MSEFDQTLQELLNPDEPLSMMRLVALSNLDREEQARVNSVWEDIALEKRRRLVRALGELAEDDVQVDFTAVFRRAMSDSDARVRADAIEGLWEDESYSLVRPLLLALENDPSEQVRTAAAAGLGRFVLQGELDRISEERYRQIVEALHRVFTTPTCGEELRRRALESIAYSGDERVRRLIARAYEEASDKMRASAIFAMGRSADEYWRGAVQAEMGSPNPEMRYEAARAAGELEDEGAVGQLIQLLSDVDSEVQQAAIWALGQIGGEVARRALERVAAGLDEVLSEAAQEALAMAQLNSGIFDPRSFVAPRYTLETDGESDDWDEEDQDWDEEGEDWDEEDEDEDWDEDWDEEDEDEEWDEDWDEDWNDEDDVAGGDISPGISELPHD